MSSGWTIIELATTGDAIDMEQIAYGGAPTTRKRTRTVITGTTELAIADVVAAHPGATAYGLPVRPMVTSQAGPKGTPVAANVASHQILAANNSRVKAVITNDPQLTAGARLHLAFGEAATLDHPIVLYPWDTWIEVEFKGEIRGIWDVANGRTLRQELTP